MRNPLPKENNYRYVPPNYLDWHRQVATMFQLIKDVQQFLTGMKWMFVIDGCEIPRLYSIVLPILVIMGDMPFLNKVVGMRGNLQGNRICRMCNVERTNLDNPYCHVVETDSEKVKQKMLTDPVEAKELGYYPMKDNVFHSLQFCHAKGLNQSTPVEPLHCVLLGLFIRLLQGFNRLRKKGMIDRIAMAHANGQNITNQAHHVFTGDFLEEVECQLSKIGFALRQQCDPDIPRTYFPSGYLPDASAKDDNTTEKNGT